MTQRSTNPVCDHGKCDYLAVLQSLCVEVQDGTSALASNNVEKFKRHLAAQQELCIRLRQISAAGVTEQGAGLPRRQPLGDHLLAPRIHSTHCDLVELNRRYAALVRRSSRTITLLNTHCQTFLDGFGATLLSPHCSSTWSSEV